MNNDSFSSILLHVGVFFLYDIVCEVLWLSDLQTANKKGTKIVQFSHLLYIFTKPPQIKTSGIFDNENTLIAAPDH